MKRIFITGFILGTLTFNALAQTLTGNISGSFDPSSSGDNIGSTNPTPFSSMAVGYADYQAWQTAVASAYTGGTGTVWDSSVTSGASDSSTAVDLQTWTAVNLDYATNKVFTLSLSSITDSGSNAYFQSTQFGSANGTSGYRVFAPDDSGTTTAYTLSFALSGSGLAAGEYIKNIAFALSGRSGAVGTVTLTANFSNATNQSLTLGTTLGTQGTDSFFQFTAPTNASIVSLTYSSTTGRVNPLDDFSFTTAVPEPSTDLLAGLGLFGLLGLVRRRLKHAKV